MEIILIEKVTKLGEIGSTVSVKNGFARNYLIPQGKAIRATEANKKLYEEQREKIAAENKAKKSAAEKMASSVPTMVTLIRQASEDSKLFGSVNARDIIAEINQLSGLNLNRTAVILNQVIKYIGIYEIGIELHPDVHVQVKVNVSRSEDEAQQALSKMNSENKTEENKA